MQRHLRSTFNGQLFKHTGAVYYLFFYQYLGVWPILVIYNSSIILIATRIENGMLRWFHHLEEMDHIYSRKEFIVRMCVEVSEEVVPGQTFTDQIGKRVMWRASGNDRIWWMCTKRKRCQESSKWVSIVSVYLSGKQVWLYVFMDNNIKKKT